MKIYEMALTEWFASHNNEHPYPTEEDLLAPVIKFRNKTQRIIQSDGTRRHTVRLKNFEIECKLGNGKWLTIIQFKYPFEDMSRIQREENKVRIHKYRNLLDEKKNQPLAAVIVHFAKNRNDTLKEDFKIDSLYFSERSLDELVLKHVQAVENALNKGLIVPLKAIKFYPEIARKYGLTIPDILTSVKFTPYIGDTIKTYEKGKWINLGKITNIQNGTITFYNNRLPKEERHFVLPIEEVIKNLNSQFYKKFRNN